MGCGNSKTKEMGKPFMTQDQKTAKNSEVFLISCMDFRLLDDIVRAMDRLGYNNNYDQFIVAGSSLGVVQDKFPHWGKTCIEHMEIGLKLHDFRKVMVIDHEDCGAYKKFFPELVGNLELEKKYHAEYIQKLFELLIRNFPNMDFESYLMDLDGNVKAVPVDKTKGKDVEHKIEDNNDKFLSEMENDHNKKKKN